MSWVLIKQVPTQDQNYVPDNLQTQAIVGGPQGGLLISPDKPVDPTVAGQQAMEQYLSGRRRVLPDRAPDTTFLPQARQNIADTASRFARTAGKYGGLAAALGGGLKNLYDQTASGEPLSFYNLGTSGLGAYQFASPLATRAGADIGTRVGVRQADNLRKPLTESQAAEPFAMPEQTDMGMFDAQAPASSPTVFRHRNPAQRRYTEFMRNTPEARRIRSERSQQTFPVQVPLMGKVFDMAPPTPAPSMAEDSSAALQSALPNPVEQIKEQQSKQMEEQKERQEKQQEMKEEERQKFTEEMRNRQDEQSTGV